jgi:5-aminolevulinate synthase
MMDYDNYFREHLEALHREGRYRVFAELKRRCGAYPAADQFTGKGTRDVTVWCSNLPMPMPKISSRETPA